MRVVDERASTGVPLDSIPVNGTFEYEGRVYLKANGTFHMKGYRVGITGGELYHFAVDLNNGTVQSIFNGGGLTYQTRVQPVTAEVRLVSQ